MPKRPKTGSDSGLRPHFLRLTAAVLLAHCVLMGVAAAADFIDLRRAAPIIGGDAERGRERATTCLACHDATGMGIAPIFPNLRGQTIDYLYWALVDFQRGTREASPMTPLVANLTDQDLRDLAAFYASTTAETLKAGAPAAGANPDVLARGESLFLRGDSALGVPPCQGCHGAEARGHPLATSLGAAAPTHLRTYPALTGQPSMFLTAKLGEYRNDALADSTNDFIMAGVARGLDDAAIAVLAAWLSSLAPP